MRNGPTSRYSTWAVAALTTLALIGCATSDGEGVDEQIPTESESKDAPPAEKKADNTEVPLPAFEPAFDPSTTPKKTDDPAPPNSDQCIDNDDPGNAENVAKQLPATDDCDNDYKTVSGVANGAVDVDFYKVSATDKGASLSHPVGCKLDTDFASDTAGTELCVFMRCKNSTIDAVTGCESGSPAKSDIGMNGCCAAAPGKAVPKWDCSGLGDNDSADIFMKVRQINGEKCLPYKLRYRF